MSITFDDGYDDNHTRIFETNDPVELLREKVLGYWDPIGFVDLTSSWLSGLVSPVDFAY